MQKDDINKALEFAVLEIFRTYEEFFNALATNPKGITNLIGLPDSPPFIKEYAQAILKLHSNPELLVNLIKKQVAKPSTLTNIEGKEKLITITRYIAINQDMIRKAAEDWYTKNSNPNIHKNRTFLSLELMKAQAQGVDRSITGSMENIDINLDPKVYKQKIENIISSSQYGPLPEVKIHSHYSEIPKTKISPDQPISVTERKEKSEENKLGKEIYQGLSVLNSELSAQKSNFPKAANLLGETLGKLKENSPLSLQKKELLHLYDQLMTERKSFKHKDKKNFSDKVLNPMLEFINQSLVVIAHHERLYDLTKYTNSPKEKLLDTLTNAFQNISTEKTDPSKPQLYKVIEIIKNTEKIDGTNVAKIKDELEVLEMLTKKKGFLGSTSVFHPVAKEGLEQIKQIEQTITPSEKHPK